MTQTLVVAQVGRPRPVLFLLAMGVPALAAVSYCLNVGRPAEELLVPLSVVAGVALACYIWMRIRIPTADQTIYCIGVVLLGMGLVLIARLEPARFEKQILWSCIALLATTLTATLVRRPEKLASYQYLCGLFAVLLVLAPWLLHSMSGGRGDVTADKINGARLWIQFGGLFSLQPAEFAKILVAVFLAGYLIEKGDALAYWPYRILGIPAPPLRHAAPVLLIWLASLGLLAAQKDLGCALLVFCLFLEMLYSATGRAGYPIVGLALFALGAGALVQLGTFSHVQTRINAWLNPWSEAHGGGYQMLQSLFALGQGDVLGTGLGRGLPRSIPEVSTDFIFAAIAEELGLLGGCAIILCYAILVVRGFVAAGRAKDDFCALLCAGLTAGLVTQAAIIICGVTKFLPMTGITLPFVSYGGSSIVASGVALGLILRISADPSPMPRPAGDRPRTRPLAWIHLVAFLVLSLWLGYWQIVRGPGLNVHPLNPRLAVVEESITRGRILDRNGEVLAEEAPAKEGDGSKGARRYPYARAAAHVVGYRSARFGSAGVEADAAGWLLGLNQRTDGVQSLVTQVRDRKRSLPSRGGDVILSLDIGLQQRAHELLGDRKGAVVALSPRTGEVFCLVSRPTFDPADLETILAEVADSPEGASAAALMNRATDGLYPPGSTFKMLTAAAALDARAITPTTHVTCDGEEIIHFDRIRCNNLDGHGDLTVEQAFIQSCNIGFAKIGDRLGGEQLVSYCEEFGFELTPPAGLRITPSRVPKGLDMTEAMLLESSFGQGALQVTPIQMALIAGAIGNGGTVMTPQIIREVRMADGQTVYTMEPSVWRAHVVRPDVAATVGQWMRRVVTEGTGGAAALSGVSVAGKTGTAENPQGKAHAWFAGYAPAEDPEIALAVVVEHGGGGGAVAAPIAREVFRRYFAR